MYCFLVAKSVPTVFVWKPFVTDAFGELRQRGDLCGGVVSCL